MGHRLQTCWSSPSATPVTVETFTRDGEARLLPEKVGDAHIHQDVDGAVQDAFVEEAANPVRRRAARRPGTWNVPAHQPRSVSRLTVETRSCGEDGYCMR